MKSTHRENLVNFDECPPTQECDLCKKMAPTREMVFLNLIIPRGDDIEESNDLFICPACHQVIEKAIYEIKPAY